MKSLEPDLRCLGRPHSSKLLTYSAYLHATS